MKITIFTGTIVLNRDNLNVRTKYIIERLGYLTECDDLELTLVCPNDISEDLEKFNLVPYKFLNKKHCRFISMAIFSFLKLLTIDCDLLHCFSFESATVASLSQIFRKKKIPILFEPMGLAAEESRINARTSLKIQFLRSALIKIENAIFRYSYGVIVYTETLKEYISEHHELPEDKVFVVPHGVDHELFAKDYNKDLELVNKLGLQNYKRIILYVGTISELHGSMNLIKAIEIINNKINEVVLVIVGSGWSQTQVRAYIKKKQLNNVILVEPVPHNEIHKYYGIADILVIPHAKCLQTELDPPTKLFEYLASGKPIVSSDLKAIADIVGKNAVLVEPDSPQSLAEGILKILNNAEFGEKMGRVGKKMIYNYSWKESARKQYNIYRYIFNSADTKNKSVV